MASVRVVGIYDLKTGEGKRRLLNCKIEEGSIDTNHPGGKTTYYDLLSEDGTDYRVPMGEAYGKKQVFTGSSIGFWFSLKNPIPQVGDRLTVSLCRKNES